METKIIIETNGIKDAIMSARSSQLNSSWRKPVYCKNYRSLDAVLNDLKIGDVVIEMDFSGSWLCNAYTPGLLELFAIRAWECGCVNEEVDEVNLCDHSYEIDNQYDNICSNLHRMFSDDLKQYTESEIEVHSFPHKVFIN